MAPTPFQFSRSLSALGSLRESQRADDSGTGASGAEGQSRNDSGVASLYTSESRAHGPAEGAVAHDYRKSRPNTSE